MKNVFTILLIILCINFSFKAIAQTPEVEFTPATTSRDIPDFYGINGQGALFDESSYANTDVQAQLLNANASYLRYPSGTIANYWDWQEGWFFRNINDNGPISMDLDYQKKLRIGVPNTSVYNTANFNGLENYGGDYLADFEQSLAATSTKPLFIVNPLSSDKYYQLAMMLESKRINLNPVRIEIGNEFYLTNASYMDKFSNSIEYGDLVADWSTLFKDYLGPDIKIIAHGANRDHNGSTGERRENWNPQLYSTLSTNLPDYFAIHQYRKSGITAYSSVATDYKIIFDKVNDDITDLNTYISQLGSATPILMTEYNLFDRDLTIHGTWYAALYAAYNTLKFLENSRIQGCNLHALAGDFIFDTFYTDNDGLNSGGGFKAPTCTIPTQAYGKTSSGIAMDQLGIAFNGATKAFALNFAATTSSPAPIPTLNGGGSSVYGWLLEKGSPLTPEVVIMNLSNSDMTTPVSYLNSLGFTLGTDEYVQVNSDEPTSYATGFTNSSPDLLKMTKCSSTTVIPTTDIDKSSYVIPSSGSFTLKAFSITRIYKTNSFPSPLLYAMKDTIEAGSTVLISAVNNPSYKILWSTSDTTNFISVSPTTTTTYSATFTAMDFSTVTKYITIIVTDPLPNITIKTSTHNACPGEDVVLDATIPVVNAGDYKYVWISTPVDDAFPDFNHGIGTTATITVNPTVPTIYTVYATNGTFVKRNSIFINVPAAIDIKPEYTFCLGSDPVEIPFETTGSSEVDYDYIWYGSSAISQSSSSFSITPPSISESSYLFLTSTIGTCTVTKQVTVNFFDCCENTVRKIRIPPGSDLNDLIALNTGTPPPVTMTHSNNGNVKVTCSNSSDVILIDGDFHIRDDIENGPEFNYGLDLKSCTVLLSEGASITVEPGFTFTIDDVVFDAACEKMWKGIIVDAAKLQKVGGMDVIGDATFKNAEIAVNSLPGSTVDIRFCNFLDNLFGLKSTNLSSNNKNIQFLTCFRSQFEILSSPLLPAYAGQFYFPDETGTAGMYLKDVAANIGSNYASATSNTNSFKNLNAGIVANNCALSVQNSAFKDIQQSSGYRPLGFNWGIGIYADDITDGASYLKYDGRVHSSLTDGSMNNCYIGIDAHETELDVKNSQMEEMNFGIISSDNNTTDIDIFNNEIHATESCIDLVANDNSPAITVSENYLYPNNTAEYPDAYGIRVLEAAGRQGEKDCDILCNSIVMEYAVNGIYLRHCNRVNIIGNYIPQSRLDYSKTGLLAENASLCNIISNSIGAYGSSGYNVNDGYYFASSPDNYIYHNTTENTRYGFQFEGTCPSDFKQNEMNNHDKGLRMFSGATMDPQTDKGNKWYGTYAIPVTNEHLGSAINIATSLFTVKSGQGARFNPSATAGWFDPGSTVNAPEGTLMSPCEKSSERMANSGLTYSEELMLQGEVFDSTFYAESKTNNAKFLYEKFYLNDSLLNSTADYIDFKDSLDLKASGKLSEIRLKLASTNTVLENKEELKNNGIAAMLSQMDSLSTVDSTIVYDKGLYEKIYATMDKANAASADFKADLQASVDAQESINSSISPGIIVNENEQKLNEILIHHNLAINTSYCETEKDIITSIAQQCPREGGKSVYMARNMMYAIDNSIIYNDSSTCATVALRRGRIVQNENVTYRMLPDRQNNMLKFTGNAENENRLMVKVYDVQGKILLNTIADSNSSIHFNLPKQSFYLISIMDDANHQSNFKLIW